MPSFQTKVLMVPLVGGNNCGIIPSNCMVGLASECMKGVVIQLLITPDKDTRQERQNIGSYIVTFSVAFILSQSIIKLCLMMT